MTLTLRPLACESQISRSSPSPTRVINTRQSRRSVCSHTPWEFIHWQTMTAWKLSWIISLKDFSGIRSLNRTRARVRGTSLNLMRHEKPFPQAHCLEIVECLLMKINVERLKLRVSFFFCPLHKLHSRLPQGQSLYLKLGKRVRFLFKTGCTDSLELQFIILTGRQGLCAMTILMLFIYNL